MSTQAAGILAIILFLTLPACGDGSGSADSSTNAPQSNSPAAKPVATSASAPPSEAVPVYTYEVVASYPHDTKAYTQGLVYRDDMFYESTGQYGESSLRKVELKKGKVKKMIAVPGQYFAEGMTILNGKIYQLTWQQGKGFIYDLKDFEREGEFDYDGEGWGLATDGQYLILSDGTNTLRFIEPGTFRVAKSVQVLDGEQPVEDLNELEYINGEIYANVWKTDRIARIDPRTGRVTSWIDLSGLRPAETLTNSENVLNGIAYDHSHDRLYVTGKRWPKIFEIRLKKK